MANSNIVSTEWVRQRLEAGDVVVADVRFSPKIP